MKRRTRSIYALLALLMAAFTLMPLMEATGRAAHAETTEEARTRLLGPGYDSPDVVRLKWVSITTVLASFGGHPVLFDSTVMNYLGQPTDKTDYMTLADVIAIKPEFIFQNHVHLDQMRHAAKIAAATGAPIVGAEEHCNFVKRDAAVKRISGDIKCILVRDANGKAFTGLDTYASPVQPPIFTPWGTFGKPEVEPSYMDVTAVNIKHTQIRPYPGSLVGNEGYVPDVTPYAKTPPTPESAVDFGLSQDDEGGNLLYIVKYKDFTFVDHGSAGSLDPLEPGQQEVKDALRKIGATDQVDVEMGGIAELQNYFNGLIDERRYSEQINAKVMMPIHHGNWNPPATSDAKYYYQPWKAEMAKMDPNRRPDLCFLVEANRATAFNINPSEWAGSNKGSITPVGGPDCYKG
jgi:hypothetical protein